MALKLTAEIQFKFPHFAKSLREFMNPDNSDLPNGTASFVPRSLEVKCTGSIQENQLYLFCLYCHAADRCLWQYKLIIGRSFVLLTDSVSLNRDFIWKILRANLSGTSRVIQYREGYR